MNVKVSPEYPNVTWSRGMSRMSQILLLRYWRRKSSNSFVLFCFQYWYIDHNSVTRHPILMGFASNRSIFKLTIYCVKNSKLKNIDMWLISLDHVTFVSSTALINFWMSKSAESILICEGWDMNKQLCLYNGRQQMVCL